MKKLGKKLNDSQETIEAYCTSCSYCGCSCPCDSCGNIISRQYYIGYSAGASVATSSDLTSNGSYASLG